MRTSELPRAVTYRLSLYVRQLNALARDGVTTVSSNELGQALGLTPAQVRKDLASVGQLGFPGVGYRVALLAAELRRALGTDRDWKIALVGVGHLGSALIRHKGFREQGFVIAATFDKDPALHGRTVEGLTIRPVEEIGAVVGREGIRLAMIAVPAEAAQDVADRLVAAGVKGILNFAAVGLDVRDDVQTSTVDLSMHLEQLTYHVTSLKRGGDHGP